MTNLNNIPVLFEPEAHTYTNTETGELLKGITSTLIHRLFPNKYADIPEEVLRKAAERGTKVHEELELINSLGIDPVSDEGKNYVSIVENEGLKYLASEYTVSDLEHYATNIDVVYDVEDGVVDIADYKTTSKFDRESVSWQLSICAYFLEKNNPDVKVRNLYGIWLRGEDISQLIQVNRHSDEEVQALIQADIDGKDYEFVPLFPSYIADNEMRLVYLGKRIKELTEEYDALKGEILEQMVSHNDKSFDLGSVLITVTAPSVRKSFDSKTFKAEHADLYGQYEKEVTTKESLKITLR